MSGMIDVNRRKAEAGAARIESAAEYFQSVPLAPQDTRTTLSANQKGKSAYGMAQEGVKVLGVSLDREARNIRELYAAFEEFDDMMGELAAVGSRYPVIRAAN